MKKRFWEFRNAANNTGELYIYGVITSFKWDESDTTAQSFKNDLDGLGDINKLNVYINSPGGSVFQGVAIHTMLKRHKAEVNVYIDGVAASIASVIAMAGDRVFMPKNTTMMIHKPWNVVMGNADVLRKAADTLDKIQESIEESYLAKTGDAISGEKLSALLAAETWLTAQECLEYGLCDEIIAANEVAACLDEEAFAYFNNVPESLKNVMKSPDNSPIPDEERQKMLTESKQNLEKISNILGGL